MILVRIELISAVHESRSRSLGQIRISNTGENAGKARHDYVVEFYDRSGKRFKKIELKGWPRNTRSVWQMIATIFKQTWPKV